MNQAIDDSNEHVNKITSNMLLSVIGVFLGISLTSAMITTADKILTNEYLIIYYFGIGWLIVSILGTSTLITQKFTKKASLLQ